MICFSGMKLRRAEKIIRTVSPTALAVFVIHVHTITWNHLFYSLPNRLGLWKTGSAAKLCANIIGWALSVFVICVLLDLLRIGIFKRLGIDKLLKTADAWLDRRLDRLSGR